MATINVGDSITCAETGRTFFAQRDGCSFNYATDSAGRVYSDEGVDIRERRALLDRSKPFGCYVSGDGRRVTGWKGNTLGHVIMRSSYRGSFGGRVYCWTVIDVHGGAWHGRNSGEGMCITLRPSKG